MAGHNHAHHHDASSERIGYAFFLNVTFTIIEFIGGYLTNSTAIMADAVHDLGDSLSIGSAWLLNRLGKKNADDEFTYGYRRLSLLGALLNGIVLLVGSIWVLTEALPRLANPVMPVAEGMLALAILGVSVNGYAAYKLSHGTTLNERVLNWHLLEDVLGWVAVLIVSIVLQFKHWPILDPVLSIGFTLFILFNVFRNLIATMKLFFQAVPDKELLDKIRQSLISIREVEEVHHLHLWSLDGENHVLTAHVVVAPSIDSEIHKHLRAQIHQGLVEFNLNHTTIEIEFEDEECRDA
ncbi:MAG: cation diffusion facilitator family transporter [Gammaproteobacteria bacterium]|nr:cation diffusion facilitator family transporter [Gammaproteobacteria bacterium]